MVMRKCSLNSKAHGNCSDSCHTHSRNWSMTGDSSLGSPSRWAYLQGSQQHTDGQIQNLNWVTLNDVWAPLTDLWENLCPKLTQSLSIKTWNANEIKAHNWDVLKRKNQETSTLLLPWVLSWFGRKGPKGCWRQSMLGPSCPSHQSSAPAHSRLHQPLPGTRRGQGHSNAPVSLSLDLWWRHSVPLWGGLSVWCSF